MEPGTGCRVRSIPGASMVQGAEYRVQGAEYPVQGAGCRVSRVQGAGCRVYRVQGAGCRVCRVHGAGVGTARQDVVGTSREDMYEYMHAIESREATCMPLPPTARLSGLGLTFGVIVLS